jgi:hypothetical protein
MIVRPKCTFTRNAKLQSGTNLTQQVALADLLQPHFNPKYQYRSRIPDGVRGIRFPPLDLEGSSGSTAATLRVFAFHDQDVFLTLAKPNSRLK